MNHKQRKRSGGFTLIEVGCAFAVLSILATTLYLGEASQLHSVGRSFQETAAAHLLAGRLEQLMASDEMLKPGESSFEVPESGRLQDVRGVQIVRDLKPGLFKVTARLHWVDRDRRRELEMSTLIARKRR